MISLGKFSRILVKLGQVISPAGTMSPLCSMSLVVVFILGFCFLGCSGESEARNLAKEQYDVKRAALLRIACRSSEEVFMYAPLTDEEAIVDKHIIKARQKLIDVTQGTPLPVKSFVSLKPFLDSSDFFRIIQDLPKGAALYMADIGVTGLNFIISNLTYRTDAYLCRSLPRGILRLGGFHMPPIEKSCNWKPIVQLRRAHGNPIIFDAELKANLSLLSQDPLLLSTGREYGWRRIEDYRFQVSEFYSYLPFRKEMLLSGLEDLLKDNIMAVELMTSMGKIRGSAGKELSPEEIVQFYADIIKNFNIRHQPGPGIQMRIILASMRSDPVDKVLSDVKATISLMKKYRIISGFGFLGEEQSGQPLVKFLRALLYPSQLTSSEVLPYYFTVGSSLFIGSDADDSILDALMLNVSRISNGYSLSKHQKAMKFMKGHKIVTMIHPIANQFTGLVDDFMNHPASTLLAYELPVVVSSHLPALWQSFPMSHDLSIMLLYIAHGRSSLKILKYLVINSLLYFDHGNQNVSSFETFVAKWDLAIKNTIKKYHLTAGSEEDSHEHNCYNRDMYHESKESVADKLHSSFLLMSVLFMFSILPLGKGIGSFQTFLGFIILGNLIVGVMPISEADYLSSRKDSLKVSSCFTAGSDIELSGDEWLINDFLVAERNRLNLDGKPFLLSKSFHFAQLDMERSNIFKIIRKMPKGAALGIFDLGLTSINWIVTNLTYRPEAYQCVSPQGYIKLSGFTHLPVYQDCKWEQVIKKRSAHGNPVKFDKSLRDQLLVRNSSPLKFVPSNSRLEQYVNQVKGMYQFFPFLKDLFGQGLLELIQDNVMFLELRLSVHEVHDTFNRPVSMNDVIRALEAITDSVKKKSTSFLGVRFIVSVKRAYPDFILRQELSKIKALVSAYPKLVVGLGFMWPESGSRSINNISGLLLEPISVGGALSPSFHYYLRSRDELFSGPMDETDIVDAVLLQAKRIASGYRVLNFFQLVPMIKDNFIAIEVNLISNQVSGLLLDFRNHPAAQLIAYDMPFVITSDYPAAYGTTALSHDIFIALVAMTPIDYSLAILKQFVMNSITFSSLNQTEEESPHLERLSDDWGKFVDYVINEFQLESSDSPVTDAEEITSCSLLLETEHSVYANSTEKTSAGNNRRIASFNLILVTLLLNLIRNIEVL